MVCKSFGQSNTAISMFDEQINAAPSESGEHPLEEDTLPRSNLSNMPFSLGKESSSVLVLSGSEEARRTHVSEPQY